MFITYGSMRSWAQLLGMETVVLDVTIPEHSVMPLGDFRVTTPGYVVQLFTGRPFRILTMLDMVVTPRGQSKNENE